ncbi:MAG: M14 family metallocarboxypeptidase [Nitrospinota bacterium]
MVSVNKKNNFDSVVQRIEKCLLDKTTIEFSTTYKTSTAVYPLIKIVLGRGNSPRVLISAGIHGDEPGGVETILKFLEAQEYSHYINDWEINLLPCLNPHGFEYGIRENHQEIDLNRVFKIDNPPKEVTFAKSILDTGFELTLELHEDTDSHGYYLYQNGTGNRFERIGQDVLDSVKSIMPINLDPEIDGSPANQGIIDKGKDNSKMDWWPMALYGLSQGTQSCLTLEASSQFDLPTRVEAHLKAIQTALTFT